MHISRPRVIIEQDTPQWQAENRRTHAWSTIGTRDRNVFPHSGMLFKGPYETAAASYGGNVDFLKTSLSSEGCLPVAEHHTLIIDVSAWYGSGTLPYQEQFEIGGAVFLLGHPLPGYHQGDSSAPTS